MCLSFPTRDAAAGPQEPGGAKPGTHGTPPAAPRQSRATPSAAPRPLHGGMATPQSRRVRKRSAAPQHPTPSGVAGARPSPAASTQARKHISQPLQAAASRASRGRGERGTGVPGPACRQWGCRRCQHWGRGCRRWGGRGGDGTGTFPAKIKIWAALEGPGASPQLCGEAPAQPCQPGPGWGRLLPLRRPSAHRAQALAGPGRRAGRVELRLPILVIYLRREGMDSDPGQPSRCMRSVGLRRQRVTPVHPPAAPSGPRCQVGAW